MRRRALLLLTTTALILIAASGTAMAEINNGSIYFDCDNLPAGVCSIDPAASNSQPTYVRGDGNIFDISRDRKTVVYKYSHFGGHDSNPFYTAPLFNSPFSGPSLVQIT